MIGQQTQERQERQERQDAQPAQQTRAGPIQGQIIQGHIDGVEGCRLHGWAFDARDPDRGLDVRILIDGTAVGTARADRFRADLQDAGYGTGRHGFALEVPIQYRDGRPHRIDAVDPATGAALPNSPRMVRLPAPDTARHGGIEPLDGTTLVGWIRDSDQPDAAVEVVVTEAGHVLTRGVADQRRPDGTLGFAIPLPATVCDGRPHAFTVEAAACPGVPLAALAVVVPFLVTPEAVLADYADRHLRGRLSNAAADRYRALVEQMEAVGALEDGAAAAERARDVAAAHALLVRDAPRTGQDVPVAPFGFPPVAAPVASVLVPAHNAVAFTAHCLASLRLMPNDTPFEILLLDDGSSDETTTLETVIQGIRVVRNPTALGFVRTCNAGAAHARGRYLVLLNNDTEVTPHWLDHLLAPFDQFDDVGLVGARLIAADGTLQEAGGLIWRDGSAWNYGRGGNPRDPRYGYLRETDYCSAACIALERADWDALGGFDEAFAPAYYEDTDLAFRVRAAGRRVLYQPLCEVIHFEGATNGTDETTGVKACQATNRPTFLDRWSHAFHGNGMPGDDPDVAKDRGYVRRVLVIDTEVPQPDRSAGHYAAIQEIRLLQSLGFRPTVLPQNMAHLGRYTDALAGMGVEVIHAPFFPSPEAFLSQRGRAFDLVYITRYHVVGALIDAVRRHCPQARVVFNTADLHFLRLLRAAVAEQRPDKVADACLVRDEELAVMRRVDLTLSYSEVEHAVVLSHTLGTTKMAKCPWVVSPKPAGPSFEARQDIAFLGGFRHPPNLEAVRMFVRDVMPLVREALPGVAFRIYGSHPPPALYDLEADDVIVEGFVESLDAVFHRCRVFVAPLVSGAGLKGKLIEAFSYGTPAVVSDIAVEATGARDGVDVLVATTPTDWADKVAKLYTDAALWSRMADSAADFARTHYSFANGRAVLRKSLADLGLPAIDGLHTRS